MKRFIKPTILLFLITASTFIAFAQIDVDYVQVGEDIEIMAKIIDKTIQKEFPDESRISVPFFSRGLGGCQGIYLKGYGAIFMTGVGFPVAEKKMAQKEERSDDLWQQTKAEMVGGGRVYGSTSGEFNPEKVGKLKEELLKAIGTYGSKIRQLASQENIVVAIHGTSSPFQPFIAHTGTNLTVPYVSLKSKSSDALAIPAPEVPPVPSVDANPIITEGHSTGSKKESEGPEVNGPEVKTPEIKQKEMQEKTFEIQKKATEMNHIEIELKEVQKNIAHAQKEYEKAIKEYRVIGTPDATGKSHTTLVIKVSKENIISYKNNAMGFDEFLKKAEITQY